MVTNHHNYTCIFYYQKQNGESGNGWHKDGGLAVLVLFMYHVIWAASVDNHLTQLLFSSPSDELGVTWLHTENHLPWPLLGINYASSFSHSRPLRSSDFMADWCKTNVVQHYRTHQEAIINFCLWPGHLRSHKPCVILSVIVSGG